MKKRVVMMAALMLTAGGMAFAQQPESTEPEKQEVAAPAPESATEASTTQEEKAEKDGDCKGDCTKEKCGTADSSSSDNTETDE